MRRYGGSAPTYTWPMWTSADATRVGDAEVNDGMSLAIVANDGEEVNDEVMVVVNKAIPLWSIARQGSHAMRHGVLSPFINEYNLFAPYATNVQRTMYNYSTCSNSSPTSFPDSSFLARMAQNVNSQ